MDIWQKMHDFTVQRNQHTPDELWVLEHPPVFTQGQAGKPEHILNASHIPIVSTDRGGQVTYHGPGQIIIYVLFDLKRANIGVRQFVSRLENGVIEFLASYGIKARNDCSRPGVYVGEEKIASIGLRIKKGCSFHGLSFNADMDLSPFRDINPCGYQALKMTQLKAFIPIVELKTLQQQLAGCIQNQLHLRSDPEIISQLQ
ncbi:MAG: lipoyl(octanoyl) transferase LipB [Gammaproteobacteria bacterium]|nr:lipoyl(octanoyl) transferase LipB [Gammaproteobacteria bacterium]